MGPLIPRDVHQQALIDRASQLGIEVEDLRAAWGCDAVRYTVGARQELVFKGRRFSSLSAQAAFLCDHKHATKAVLAEAGIPVPDGVYVQGPDHAEMSVVALLERFGAVVCKPVDGTHGDGVKTGLDSVEAVNEHIRAQPANSTGWVIEEQVGGDDLRLQAVGGRLVAACRREPAHVVGDGRHTITELAARRDATCRSQNPLNRLLLDGDSLTLLAAQGLAVGDVPAVGRRVRLKTLSNISLGGLPIDLTDSLHPTYAEWVERISDVLGLRIFSVDLLTSDHRTVTPDARVLEVNARPEWLHHTFSEGTTHDMPGLILGDLFELSPAPG